MSGLLVLGRRGVVLGVDPGDTRPMDEYARAVEAEFLEMKSLAEKAGWPKDLTPTVVNIDRKWQAAKAAANAKNQSVVREVGPDSELRAAIRKTTEALKAGIARGAEQAKEKGVTPGAPGAPPYIPDETPTWKKVVLAAAVAGVIGGGVLLLRRIG